MYATGQYTNMGYGCDYSTAMRRANRMHQTRLGQLCRKYRKASSDPMIRKLMEPWHCPFYEWNGSGKKTESKPLGEPVQERKAPVRDYVPPVSEEALQEAYDRGLSDLKIAQELKLSAHQVAMWRRDRGLESNFVIQKKKRCIDPERAMRLYMEGRTDAGIAEDMGVNQTAVFAWRVKNGLPANGKAKIRDKQDMMFEMYHEGCSDREIAMEVGVTKNAIASWRYKNGLPANFKRGERRRHE